MTAERLDMTGNARQNFFQPTRLMVSADCTPLQPSERVIEGLRRRVAAMKKSVVY